MGQLGSWMTAVLVVAVLAVVSGCDDDGATGCAADEDCRGSRVCVRGTCEHPGDGDTADVGFEDVAEDGGQEDVPVPPDTSPPPADAEPQRDVPGPRDTAPVPDVGIDTGPGGTVCEAAARHVTSCQGFELTYETLGITWPECGEFDECAANCALRMSCEGLACDFDLDIDCDGAPFSECLDDECRQPSHLCADDADCGATYDCCGRGWLCYHLDEAPDVCGLDCTAPPGPPCGCLNGACVQGPPPEPTTGTLCARGVERFRACGYDVEDFRDSHPDDYEAITSMAGGECSEFLACFGACVVYEENDLCMSCHFGGNLCVWDPFSECVETCTRTPQSEVCGRSGGDWGDSDCESCCGPTQCHQDPQEECALECCGPPQCYCPDERPFWETFIGCYDDDACYP